MSALPTATVCIVVSQGSWHDQPVVSFLGFTKSVWLHMMAIMDYAVTQIFCDILFPQAFSALSVVVRAHVVHYHLFVAIKSCQGSKVGKYIHLNWGAT